MQKPVKTINKTFEEVLEQQKDMMTQHISSRKYVIYKMFHLHGIMCPILNKALRNFRKLAYGKIVLPKVIQNNRDQLPVTIILTLRLIFKII